MGRLIGSAISLIAYGILNADLRKLRGADLVGRRLWLFSGVLASGAQTCQITATEYMAVVASVSALVVVLPVSGPFLAPTRRSTYPGRQACS